MHHHDSDCFVLLSPEFFREFPALYQFFHLAGSNNTCRKCDDRNSKERRCHRHQSSDYRNRKDISIAYGCQGYSCPVYRIKERIESVKHIPGSSGLFTINSGDSLSAGMCVLLSISVNIYCSSRRYLSIYRQKDGSRISGR